MPQAVTENPILNSPYAEPARHFAFSDEEITDQVVDKRRVSSYYSTDDIACWFIGPSTVPRRARSPLRSSTTTATK